MKKSSVMATVLAVIALFTVLASSAFCAEKGIQPRGPRPMQPCVFSVLNFASELDITANQFEKIKGVQKEMKPAEENGDGRECPEMKAMKEFDRELAQDAPDKAKLEELSKTIVDLKAKELEKRIGCTIKINNILTKEQKARLKEMAPKPEDDNAGDKISGNDKRSDDKKSVDKGNMPPGGPGEPKGQGDPGDFGGR